MFYLIINWYMFWAEPMSFVYSGLLFFNRHYSKRRPPSFPAVSGKQIIQDKEVISTIVGSLLGDASVHTQNKRGVNTSFSFAQSVIHVEYLLYLWEFFSSRGITSSVPPVVKELYNKSLNKTYYYVRFRTYTFSEFNFIRDMFYVNKTYNENNVIVTKRVKIVPSNIGDYLTPLALAIWYMDDGSKKLHRESGISIHTNNFTYEDNVFLCKVLKHNFNLDVITSVDKRSIDGTPYYKLYVLAHSIPLFKQIVEPYIRKVPSMMYKLYDKN